ncbi:glycoside hydrolase family 16 protein [Breznakiella homolactica]|uniref:Family 16 glycosylhydrolase n=1 Tax=Breznakiella homolactica TaxID=2798577 RepID=A0A7T8BB35_9SPIR|nr:glycoside hydrolase family 16 protein [Breznakiella homolactica]QQO09996.1 family 16 glycosylhydrolase [Breznakiella homolactica]
MMKKILFGMVLLLAGNICIHSQDPGRRKDGTITSGRVNTSGKFSFQYGRIEAGIKFPKTADGLWPAFWMLGDDFSSAGWPQCGEIDIVEMGNKTGIDTGTQERYFNGAAHWGALQDGGHPNYARASVNGYSLQDGEFHVFAMVWNEKFIAMYLDGNSDPYFIMDIEAESVRDYFHKPYFIILNLAAGGDFPRIYDSGGVTALNAENNFTAAMYVDFVRVYGKDGILIWEDEFDAGVLDAGKWNTEENSGGGGNHELQEYRGRNISVETDRETGKSCLVITAKMD